jgi:hypothetical protein
MPSLQPGQVSEPLALLLLPQPNVYKNLRHESGSRPANSEWLLRQFSMKKRETFVWRWMIKVISDRSMKPAAINREIQLLS